MSATLDLPHFLPYLLSRVSNAVSEGLAEVYRESAELTLTEWRLLVVLAAQPGIPATELVRITLIDKVAISRALKRLLARKLVRRTLVRNDRRQRRLRLSDAGLALYESIAPRVARKERELLAMLGEAGRSQLEALLQRVLDGL
jgi:DNA-binding MarR family transcriptional regulator